MHARARRSARTTVRLVYVVVRFSQYPGRRFTWATARTLTSVPRSMNTTAYGKRGEERAPDTEVLRQIEQARKRGWRRPDQWEDTFGLGEELHPEPTPPGSLPIGNLGQFGDRASGERRTTLTRVAVGSESGPEPPPRRPQGYLLPPRGETSTGSFPGTASFCLTRSRTASSTRKSSWRTAWSMS